MARPTDRRAGDPEALRTTSFSSGRDASALLRMIERTLWWNPEERWDRDRLERETRRPDFDPEAIRMHYVDDELRAVCWTSRLLDHSPPFGLITIAAVDPDHGREGLGRRVVIAGLEHLAGRGFGEVQLYVESNNLRAVRMYLALGFVVERTVYRYGEVPLDVPKW